MSEGSTLSYSLRVQENSRKASPVRSMVPRNKQTPSLLGSGNTVINSGPDQGQTRQRQGKGYLYLESEENAVVLFAWAHPEVGPPTGTLLWRCAVHLDLWWTYFEFEMNGNVQWGRRTSSALAAHWNNHHSDVDLLALPMAHQKWFNAIMTEPGVVNLRNLAASANNLDLLGPLVQFHEDQLYGRLNNMQETQNMLLSMPQCNGIYDTLKAIQSLVKTLELEPPLAAQAQRDIARIQEQRIQNEVIQGKKKSNPLDKNINNNPPPPPPPNHPIRNSLNNDTIGNTVHCPDPSTTNPCSFGGPPLTTTTPTCPSTPTNMIGGHFGFDTDPNCSHVIPNSNPSIGSNHMNPVQNLLYQLLLRESLDPKNITPSNPPSSKKRSAHVYDQVDLTSNLYAPPSSKFANNYHDQPTSNFTSTRPPLHSLPSSSSPYIYRLVPPLSDEEIKHLLANPQFISIAQLLGEFLDSLPLDRQRLHLLYCILQVPSDGEFASFCGMYDRITRLTHS